ncbi:MAG: peptidyl-prolyl cis-trans isomerase [Kiloniellales bacterium]
MISDFGSKLLREPLVHFLAAGAVIFGLYGLTRGEAESAADHHIVVTAGDIARLAGLWQKRWQSRPTPDELKGLIDRHVQQEVLYREALALGLDRDDSVVRSRLAQKFEFLSEDLAAARDPTPEELSAFLDAHRDRYRAPPQLSLTQVYLSPDRRGSAVEHDAEVVLASLRKGSHDADLDDLGDRILLDTHYSRYAPQEIASVFGQGFADAVVALELGVWSGPIASGYGLHIVRVDERVPARMPVLAEIEARLRADWLYEQRKRANQEVLQLLLARYTVVIEGGALDAASFARPGAERRAGP